MNCPVCKGEVVDFTTHVPIDRRSTEFVICNTCGLVFAKTMPDQQELDEYYSTGKYREEVSGTSAVTAKNLKEEQARGMRMVFYLKRHLPRIKSHLDIGSSTGIFLACIYDAYNSKTTKSIGVEPGEVFRTFAGDRTKEAEEKLKIKLPQKFYASFDVVPKNLRFDLISVIQVLEHMIDPLSFLREMRSKLSPGGGHLLIEVPNLYGGNVSALQWPHLWALTSHSIQALLGAAGLDAVNIETFGSLPPFYGAPSSLMVLARPRDAEREVPRNETMRQYNLYLQDRERIIAAGRGAGGQFG